MPMIANSRLASPSTGILRLLGEGVPTSPQCIRRQVDSRCRSRTHLRRGYATEAKSTRETGPSYSLIVTFEPRKSGSQSSLRGTLDAASCRRRCSGFQKGLGFPEARSFSTSATLARLKSWLQYLSGASGARGRQLPPLASFLDASTPRQRILKAANEPRLRCTEFDEHGNVTLVNGEFKKSELIAKVRCLLLNSHRVLTWF